MNKRNLQIVMVMLGLVPAITGVLTMMGLDDPLYAALSLPRDATLDSNLRFFGGVWLGLGVAVLWLVPRIERETSLFRALWGMIFVGGIGRLLSLLIVGMPLAPFAGFIALELLGAPFLILWQSRIAKAA